jgi:hypothetical protein
MQITTNEITKQKTATTILKAPILHYRPEILYCKGAN